MQKRVLILTVKWGHFSIAKAIDSILRNEHFKVKVSSIDVEPLSDVTYTTMYKVFPQLWKLPFKLSEIEHTKKLANKYLRMVYSKKLNEIIEHSKPNIIINTYFAFNPTLEELSGKYLLINVITNPRTFSPIEFISCAKNLVFDGKALKISQKMGFDRKNCFQSGWFVRKEFEKPNNKSNVRESLKLDENRLTFCVIGGSEGTIGMLKILPAFINPPKPVQVVFICGNSKRLLKAVTVFKRMLTSQETDIIKIIPLGFVENVHQYIKSADLVIGKAGPNLLFETVATRTPFFAISHISGQEDGNLEIIKNHKLGFVEENNIKAVKLLRKLIDNPKILDRFQKHLEKMAVYNEGSGEILNEFIKSKIRS